MAFVKIVNYEGGSDARYDVNAATPEERLQLDAEGRPLSSNLPDQWTWTPGLPGARGGSGPGDMGGGGGDGSSVFGNPYFGQQESIFKAQDAADLSDTKSVIQQLLIQFGLVPGNFQDKYGALDDTIRKLIEQNTTSGISQYARMLEGKGDVLRETIGGLGSKGLLRSGAKGHKLRRNQLDFDRSFSDALQAVLSNANSIQSGYANRAFGRQMSLSQMLASIMSQYRPMSSGGGYSPPPQQSTYSAPAPAWQDLSPGAPGTPTIGGGWVGQPAPNVSLGGGSGTSSKKPLLF
jgi:hypothetical protein